MSAQRPERSDIPDRPRSLPQMLLAAGAAVLMILTLAALVTPPPPPTVSLSVLLDRAAGEIADGRQVKLVQGADTVLLVVNDQPRVQAASRRYEVDVLEMLRDRKIETKAEFESEPVRDWGSMLYAVAPLIFIAFILFSLRGGPGNMIGQRWLRARASGERPDTTFNDVAGAEEAKRELMEIVDFLKAPERYESVGARTPRGVLMSGPPGTGKTLLARAVAGEAGVPFFSMSGAEFVELFAGVAASRMRDLFAQARKAQPAIVFIDEIDAIARERGSSAIIGGGHSEQEQALMQLLTELDGFVSRGHVVIIGATNRPDILDRALTRPGRFDRQVALDNPAQDARRAILGVHVRGKPLAEDVDLDGIARDTRGFSGADLAKLANEAAIGAAREQRTSIAQRDFEEAFDRVAVGPVRGSRLNPEELTRTAIHELGHAVVALELAPLTDPVHKITVVARGHSGGHTRLRPEQERHMYERSRLVAHIAFALGGWAAERMCYGGDSSIGPSDDLTKANEIAWDMVCRYGMDDEVGPYIVDREQYAQQNGRTVSEETLALVDRRVRAVVDEARDLTQRALAPHGDRLPAIAEVLVQRETMDADELREQLRADRTLSLA